jgi:phenylalanyl-tRNA synthetase beta chain
VQRIELFDVYRGAGVPEGHKSIALGVALQAADKTLSEEEITNALQALIAHAHEALGASLRQQA